MAYQIECQECGKDTWAGNVVELLDAHTDGCGRLVCAACGAPSGYIHQITGLWEKEPEVAWDGYIKGVLRIATDSPTYVPYVFLTADSVTGEVSGLRFSYYRDPGPNGRRTDGPGPGSAPRLAPGELTQLFEKLGACGVINGRDLEGRASRRREDLSMHATV